MAGYFRRQPPQGGLWLALTSLLNIREMLSYRERFLAAAFFLAAHAAFIRSDIFFRNAASFAAAGAFAAAGLAATATGAGAGTAAAALAALTAAQRLLVAAIIALLPAALSFRFAGPAGTAAAGVESCSTGGSAAFRSGPGLFFVPAGPCKASIAASNLSRSSTSRASI